MTNSPIFIHAPWRSGSTKIWSDFRENQTCLAYYEPLHENLLDKTHDACAYSHTSKPKDSIFQHPHTDQHYFYEFPLKKEGGIDKFSKRFILEDYIKKPRENDPELTRYIQSLIDHAHKLSKRPVFQFNRTALRGAWVKEKFNGQHIYLMRQPEATFASSRSFVSDEAMAEGGPGNYFLMCPVMVVAQNAGHQIFSGVASHFKLTPFKADTFKEEVQYFTKLTDTLSVQDQYDINFFHWTVSAAHATTYADRVYDVDLAAQKDYRDKFNSYLQEKTGHRFSIGQGYKTLPKAQPRKVSPQIRELIEDACKIINPNWHRIQNGEVSPESMLAISNATGINKKISYSESRFLSLG